MLLFNTCIMVVLFTSCSHKVTADEMMADTQTLDRYGDTVGDDVETFKTLLATLLTNYDIRVRPILNQSTSIKVSTHFHPMSLIAFDTAEQKFSILGYFTIYWTDELITWAPVDHGGTNVVKFPLYQVWNPSLLVLKAFDGNGVIGNSGTDIVRVSSNGSVVWVPEGIYSVVCHVDIKFYPFDKQNCRMTYYVADETIKSVRLYHDPDVNLDEFTENTAWDVYRVSTQSYLQYDTYFIDVSFHLRRRSNFTIFTVIIPLLMLAFLNICVFLVPIGSGEKGSFAITIFLSYGIFVTIISDTLPHNSLQVSLFVSFLTTLLLLSVLSVFYTILQAKVMSSIGDNECSWQCLRSKRRDPNRVIHLDGNVEGPDPEKGIHEHGVYTWGMFLEQLDTIIFGVFFVAMLITTVAFFWLLLQQVTEEE